MRHISVKIKKKKSFLKKPQNKKEAAIYSKLKRYLSNLTYGNRKLFLNFNYYDKLVSCGLFISRS